VVQLAILGPQAVAEQYEYQTSMEHAIRRQKNIKKWKRAWKISVFEDTNPHWLDLFAQICGRDIDILPRIITLTGVPAFAGMMELRDEIQALKWVPRTGLDVSGDRAPQYAGAGHR
jgi:hypothetical protein